VLSDEAVFQYKCDNYYNKESEGAVAWNDPVLGVDWRIPADKVVLSEKDRNSKCVADADFLFDYNSII
jgi:dTDP-4-dehydrorhamnose 3,5-epimerase